MNTSHHALMAALSIQVTLWRVRKDRAIITTITRGKAPIKQRGQAIITTDPVHPAIRMRHPGIVVAHGAAVQVVPAAGRPAALAAAVEAAAVLVVAEEAVAAVAMAAVVEEAAVEVAAAEEAAAVAEGVRTNQLNIEIL